MFLMVSTRPKATAALASEIWILIVPCTWGYCCSRIICWQIRGLQFIGIGRRFWLTGYKRVFVVPSYIALNSKTMDFFFASPMMYAGKVNLWGMFSSLPGIVEVNFMKAFSTFEIARVYSICQLLHHSSIFRLFTKQKAQLSEVLDNMERWWNQSLPALESIYNESMEIQGSGTAGITPTVLPIRIKHRWGYQNNAQSCYYYYQSL